MGPGPSRCLPVRGRRAVDAVTPRHQRRRDLPCGDAHQLTRDHDPVGLKVGQRSLPPLPGCVRRSSHRERDQPIAGLGERLRQGPAVRTAHVPAPDRPPTALLTVRAVCTARLSPWDSWHGIDGTVRCITPNGQLASLGWHPARAACADRPSRVARSPSRSLPSWARNRARRAASRTRARFSGVAVHNRAWGWSPAATGGEPPAIRTGAGWATDRTPDRSSGVPGHGSAHRILGTVSTVRTDASPPTQQPPWPRRTRPGQTTSSTPKGGTTSQRRLTITSVTAWLILISRESNSATRSIRGGRTPGCPIYISLRRRHAIQVPNTLLATRAARATPWFSRLRALTDEPTG